MIHKNVRTPRDFIRIWFSWQKQALLLAVGLLSLIIMLSFLAEPRYTSTAKVIVLPRTSEGLVITSGTDEKHISRVTIEDVNTEVELMECDDLLKEVVQSYDERFQNFLTNVSSPSFIRSLVRLPVTLVSETGRQLGLTRPLSPIDRKVQMLRKALGIKTKAASNMIQLSLTTSNAESAADVLNRFLETYLEYHGRIFTIEKGEEFFESQATSFLARLDTSEQKLSEYQNEYSIVDLEIENARNFENLTGLEKELKRLQVEAEQARSRAALFREALDGESELAITESMRTIPSLIEIERALVPLLIEKSRVTASYKPTSREYQDIVRRVDAINAERDKEIEKALQTESIELRNLNAREMALSSRIEEMRRKVLEDNRTWVGIKNVLRSVDLQAKNYMLYAEKTEDARINAEKMRRNLSNVSVADYADVTANPSSPKRGRSLLLGLILAVIAALSTPFILEMFDTRLKTASDIETVLRVPVLCSIRERSE